MITSGVVVYVSCQPVDFRKGAASLMALVRDGGLDPIYCEELLERYPEWQNIQVSLVAGA